MLIEVTSASQFDSEIKGPGLVVVDFFTTWCGPCKKIAPFVESLAIKYTNVKFIKCDAEANQDVSTSRDVRAFPTFQFYVNGSMVDEIKGADPNLLEQKVIMHKVDVNPFAGQGFKLTSDSSAPAMSAREARLKNFGALEGERKPVVPKPAAPSVNDEDEALSKAMQMSLAEEKSKDVKPSASTSEAEDIAAALAEQDSIDQQAHDDEWGDEMVPVPVNQEILEQMIDMGFPDVRARKSIVHGGTLEGALAWIAEHQDDPDIDQAYMVKKSETIPKKQLTEEEKAERVKAIKDKVKQRRAERAQIEKQEEIKREKERRERGQKMDETMEERQRMMRKREAEKAKKEKLVSINSVVL